ncbi:MAG: ABC transporter ATP-binding protein [Phycisphaerae bacterium]|jgi:oligopeptide/dipeptide ABC transporter ATP-binding protein
MLLTVEDLHTHFVTPDGPVAAVAGVSLSLDRGKTLALVGESGCGKTVTALSILRLLPAGTSRIVGGRILFGGHDLLGLSEREMGAVRGNRIAMVFQEPMTSLNPVLRIGRQIEEVLERHRGLGDAAARARTVELLDQVGIPQPSLRCRQYPHELSGGLRQRALLAMALACGPDLLIADEPTTALDVTLQAQILALLRARQQASGLAILFITHDLGVVAEMADDVCVMYAGRIVEQGATADVLRAPAHPYTRGLLACTPRLAAGPVRLNVIPGEVPDPRRRPGGCAFHPRCDLGGAEPRCQREQPDLRPVAAGRRCACWLSM